MEECERLELVDRLVREEIFQASDDELIAMAGRDDAPEVEALFAQAKHAQGRARMARAREGARAGRRPGVRAAPAPGSRPASVVMLAARSAREDHGVDRDGIEEDIAELEADRARDGDET